jgi:hypothetical protein
MAAPGLMPEMPPSRVNSIFEWLGTRPAFKGCALRATYTGLDAWTQSPWTSLWNLGRKDCPQWCSLRKRNGTLGRKPSPPSMSRRQKAMLLQKMRSLEPRSLDVTYKA